MTPPPEKYDVKLIAAAFVGLVVLTLWLSQPGPAAPPEKLAEDICAGLSPVRCMEERTYEKRRADFYEELERAK